MRPYDRYFLKSSFVFHKNSNKSALFHIFCISVAQRYSGTGQLFIFSYYTIIIYKLHLFSFIVVSHFLINPSSTHNIEFHFLYKTDTQFKIIPKILKWIPNALMLTFAFIVLIQSFNRYICILMHMNMPVFSVIQDHTREYDLQCWVIQSIKLYLCPNLFLSHYIKYICFKDQLNIYPRYEGGIFREL